MSDYYEGKGCKCFARSESECSCEGVDWTPKEVYTLRKRIAELEAYLDNVKTLSIYVAFHDSARSVSLKQAREWLESFKLEQQAKGVEDALQYFSFNKDILFGDLVMVESICYTKDLQARAETLRNQAKGGDV